jgi:hypothetical protein
MTDLASVLFGMALPLANATIQEANAHFGGLSQWQVHRFGYLSSMQLGYGIANLCVLQDDDDPDWSSLLRPDARDAFRGGVRFLRKCGPGAFHLRPDRRLAIPDADLLRSHLSGRDAGEILCALWDVAEQSLTGQEFVELVTRHTAAKEPVLRQAAFETLQVISPEEIRSLLPRMMQDSDLAVRIAAYAVAGRCIAEDPDLFRTVSRELEFAISDLGIRDSQGLLINAMVRAILDSGVPNAMRPEHALRLVRSGLYGKSGIDTELMVDFTASLVAEPEQTFHDAFYDENSAETLAIVTKIYRDLLKSRETQPSSEAEVSRFNDSSTAWARR